MLLLSLFLVNCVKQPQLWELRTGTHIARTVCTMMLQEQADMNTPQKILHESIQAVGGSSSLKTVFCAHSCLILFAICWYQSELCGAGTGEAAHDGPDAEGQWAAGHAAAGCEGDRGGQPGPRTCHQDLAQVANADASCCCPCGCTCLKWGESPGPSLASVCMAACSFCNHA